jgi:predicted nucleotidyltransferase
MEKPKDRDFVETHEGLIFCVVGYLHPSDRYTAYLKYLPDPEGRWSRGGTRYARTLPYYHVSQVENTYNILKERYPRYLHSCPVRNITVSSVPCDSVRTYHRPRERLRSILTGGPRDDLEQRLADLVARLTEPSGIEAGDIGVTGSILTRSHNPEFSDIDLTVYGQTASRRLKQTLTLGRGEDLKPYDAEKKEEWSRSRSRRLPLTYKDLMGFAERRWNYGVFEGTYFSIHPTRTDDEITESYGDNTYRRLGEVEGEARIEDSPESIYLPARYALGDVETDADAEITEVVSYEGLYCDMFEPGERIRFRGALELVQGVTDHHRVVVGGAGSRRDFIKTA